MVTARSNRKMWFGTKDYADFIETPRQGADVSPVAWGASGTTLNGSGYAFNSYNSHKEYQFSWGSVAAREAAQTMKSYFDGSFGRGKLYFQDPLTYDTNVLPARWADPSITADFEGPQLVPGVDPYTVPTSNFQWLRLPVRTAVFDLDTVQPVVDTVFLPEAENLFTNPNLVGDGTWAEVRKNLAISPRMTNVNGAGATLTPSTSLGRNGAIVSGAFTNASTSPGGIGAVTEGDFVGTRLRLKTLSAESAGLTVGVRLYGGTGFLGPQVNVTLPALNREVDAVFVPDAPVSASTGTGLRVFIYPVGVSPDYNFWVGNHLVERVLVPGDSPGGYFDGYTMDDSMPQSEDFRVRWLGTPNESESVMEIERVAGLTGMRCIVGVSTREGKPAARLIPTDPSDNLSYMSFALPSEARDSGTVVGTVHMNAPLTGSTNVSVGALRARIPNQTSDTFNEAGSKDQRLYFEDITSSFTAWWYHGGTQGSGDVWWTDIGLYAGDYTGPWFSGDTEVPGKVTRWTGAPNNSTSQIGVLQPVSAPNVNEENSVFVPIPDGMQLNVGAFYSGSPEAGVYVVNATQGGSPGMNITRLQPLTPSDTNILPNVFTKAPGDIGVYIIFGKLDSVDATLSVTAIHARLSPIGVSPQGENYWLGGQGNEGVRFVQPPTYINHTGVNGGQVEFAATFKESIH